MSIKPFIGLDDQIARATFSEPSEGLALTIAMDAAKDLYLLEFDHWLKLPQTEEQIKQFYEDQLSLRESWDAEILGLDEKSIDLGFPWCHVRVMVQHDRDRNTIKVFGRVYEDSEA